MSTAVPNLEIRHATVADVDAVVRIFSGQKAVWGTLQLPFPSPERWRRRLSEPEPGLVSLLACVDAEPVGMLGLHTHPEMPRIRHSGTLGMAIRDDWQGRGLGTALVGAAVDLADRWMALNRLELQVYGDNEPALRLYRKFGFEVEGTLRRASFRDGAFVDVLTLARLRPGWGD